MLSTAVGDVMMYKGYTARYEFDEEDGVLYGRVDRIRDIVTFESSTLDGLEQEFRISVDVYLDGCAERGREPNRPSVRRTDLAAPDQPPRAHHAIASHPAAHHPQAPTPSSGSSTRHPAICTFREGRRRRPAGHDVWISCSRPVNASPKEWHTITVEYARTDSCR